MNSNNMSLEYQLTPRSRDTQESSMITNTYASTMKDIENNRRKSYIKSPISDIDEKDADELSHNNNNNDNNDAHKDDKIK
eukprot:CAMPEP_0114671396 /NCGR_PEP_ID=MMETSP0191-20121206/41092_1 /TAXON_ID=126664 /ORGANISM="Sorites sp." /LENGTH=79 /DNA_ID=CAMNT_0001931149 /DNA_START=702 /DNA_END=941 /DNA_ORIENTATION=-